MPPGRLLLVQIYHAVVITSVLVFSNQVFLLCLGLVLLGGGGRVGEKKNLWDPVLLGGQATN